MEEHTGRDDLNRGVKVTLTATTLEHPDMEVKECVESAKATSTPGNTSNDTPRNNMHCEEHATMTAESTYQNTKHPPARQPERVDDTAGMKMKRRQTLKSASPLDVSKSGVLNPRREQRQRTSACVDTTNGRSGRAVDTALSVVRDDG